MWYPGLKHLLAGSKPSIAFAWVLFLTASGVLAADGSLRAQEEDFSAPVPFASFKQILEADLDSRGADPQNQAFHFVVLLNVTHPHGPHAQWMRNIYYGLVRYYLKPGDRLTFLPYQLRIREDAATWGSTFDPLRAEGFYNQALRSAPASDERQGGHDDEAAMIDALRYTRDEHLLDSTIFILLSDKEISEPSLDPGNIHKLIDENFFARALRDDGIEMATKKDFSGSTGSGVMSSSREVQVRIWTRIYLPTKVRNLGILSQHRDAPLVRPPFPWQKAIAIGCALLLGLGAIYVFWITRLRHVQIGATTGDVKFGAPTYLAGEIAEGIDTIAVPGITGGQRFGSLEVTARGSIVMRGAGPYELMTLNDHRSVELTFDDREVLIAKRGSDSTFAILAKRAR